MRFVGVCQAKACKFRVEIACAAHEEKRMEIVFRMATSSHEMDAAPDEHHVVKLRKFVPRQAA